jgi:phytoene synthase
LARIAGAVSQQLMGEIRLAWWREQVEALFAGAPVRHPVLEALAGPAREGRLDQARLEAIIEARHDDLDPDALKDEASRLSYIDGTAGTLMAAAARLLDPSAPPEAVRSAARAWGWAGLARAGKVPAADAWPKVIAARAASRAELKALPIGAFPAAAYATLAEPYAKGRKLSDFEKRTRLVWASATGRL